MHLVFTVINSLNYDQRMQRICTSLVEAGYQVTLVGRITSQAIPLTPQPFQQKRLKLFFEKGKLFYVEYNFRLFWHLLFNKYDLFGAIDLDTIVPQFLVAKLKRKPFVYDAHEYFPEVPEVVNRPLVKKVWETVEKWIVPKTKYAYTVNQSIADIFKAKYNTHFDIIRSVTVLQDLPIVENKEERYILYQGAVNVGRGIEEMIKAMQFIDCQLYICGKGDVYEKCVALTKTLNLTDKVKFFGFVKPKDLRKITQKATLGFTFFTKQGKSYYLSLANRFFDYFHNGIPQLCVNYPEYKRINDKFEVAYLLDDLAIETIVTAVNELLTNEKRYKQLQNNCLQARKTINWEEEAKKLVRFYDNIKAKENC